MAIIEKGLVDFKERKGWAPVHEWALANGDVQVKLIARLLERRGKLYFDLREHQSGTDETSHEPYTGFTRRGVRFGLHEVERLLTILREAADEIRAEAKHQTDRNPYVQPRKDS